MKNRFFPIASIFAGALLAFAPAPKTDLQFSLKEGMTYQQQVTVEVQTVQMIMGQENASTSEMRLTTYFEVSETKDKSAIYDLWYGEMTAIVQANGMEQKMSSADPNDELSQLLGKMVEEKFQAEIDYKGEITAVTGLEEMILSLAGESENNMATEVGGSYGEAGLLRNMDMVLSVFPEGPVKKGDTWTSRQLSNTGFPLFIDNTFTLKQVKGDMAEIEVSADIVLDTDNANFSLQGMEATFFLEGVRKGTLMMEVSTGWVTSAIFDDDIAGSITISEMADFPEGLTIPIESKSKTTISGSAQ